MCICRSAIVKAKLSCSSSQYSISNLTFIYIFLRLLDRRFVSLKHRAGRWVTPAHYTISPQTRPSGALYIHTPQSVSVPFYPCVRPSVPFVTNRIFYEPLRHYRDRFGLSFTCIFRMTYIRLIFLESYCKNIQIYIFFFAVVSNINMNYNMFRLEQFPRTPRNGISVDV